MKILGAFGRLTIAVAAVVLSLAMPAAAQTSLNSTTLSASAAAGADQYLVASASNISVGDIVFVDREASVITAISSTTLTVRRGTNGTASAAHVSGAIVYTGAPGRFASSPPPSGACTRSAQPYLPRISLPDGQVWECLAGSGVWAYMNHPGALVVTCRALLVADQIDQSCFTADRTYVVVKITEIHTTAESAGTLTLIPRRQQGTEAAASGDALATAIDMVGAGAVAQTLKTATLTTTQSLLILFAGDRLGLDFTDDVAGELAGVVVTFTLIPM